MRHESLSNCDQNNKRRTVKGFRSIISKILDSSRDFRLGLYKGALFEVYAGVT
jgi:hypothetical protein